MSDVRVTYAQRQDTTPEAERNALAAVYRFVLQAHRDRKKGGPETAPDAGKEINERSGKVIIR